MSLFSALTSLGLDNDIFHAESSQVKVTFKLSSFTPYVLLNVHLRVETAELRLINDDLSCGDNIYSSFSPIPVY
jgi:hypothetical protein